MIQTEYVLVHVNIVQTFSVLIENIKLIHLNQQIMKIYCVLLALIDTP